MPKEDLAIEIALTSWDTYLTSANKVFSELSDQQLFEEIAPGKNRAIYLLGHLTAVNESMVPLLGFGDRIYPQFTELFVKQPDRQDASWPTVAEMRKAWKDVNERLNTQFKRLSAEEWFAKHTSVSEQDFQKELRRNKLNVLIHRTNHLAYHCGQLALLKR
jgi:uncharacterized damage-inducible protein DinB